MFRADRAKGSDVPGQKRRVVYISVVILILAVAALGTYYVLTSVWESGGRPPCHEAALQVVANDTASWTLEVRFAGNCPAQSPDQVRFHQSRSDPYFSLELLVSELNGSQGLTYADRNGTAQGVDTGDQIQMSKSAGRPGDAVWIELLRGLGADLKILWLP